MATMVQQREDNVIYFAPNAGEMAQVVQSDPSGGWQKCWEKGLTPWDTGKPTPILEHLHKTGALPTGRTLIPGCGSGYDVVAIACPERFVVGLDKSEKALKRARELASSSPNADCLDFLNEDFFAWKPPQKFDLIFDYTFFCAIEPSVRPAWAKQMQYLLKPDGELITLIFPITNHTWGPPYKVSIADYEELLRPLGFKPVSIVENELAEGDRKGREMLGRWKKV